MEEFELYSKAQKRLNGDVPDIYTYDDIPSALKVQITYLWSKTIGNENRQFDRNVKIAYGFIVNTFCEEYGLLSLPTVMYLKDRMYYKELVEYFLQTDDISIQLDIIQLSFQTIDWLGRDDDHLGIRDASQRVDEAIEKLNYRFREHGVGYQFVDNKIVRVDSELIHSEVVKPALKLLRQKEYEGAQQEFLNAYDHYRHGKNKEALNECLKSFESTMKSICKKRSWNYEDSATARNLIDACFSNNLVPLYWQSQLGSLRALLEGSVPVGRNKNGAHGQGTTPTSVPDYLVAYMLHMTASTLVFLITAEMNLE